VATAATHYARYSYNPIVQVMASHMHVSSRTMVDQWAQALGSYAEALFTLTNNLEPPRVKSWRSNALIEHSGIGKRVLPKVRCGPPNLRTIESMGAQAHPPSIVPKPVPD